MAMKIKKIGIVANVEKESSAQYSGSLKKWLEERGVEVFLEAGTAAALGIRGGYSRDDLPLKADLIAVLGGDGTMLRTARHVARHDVPIVGINMGNFGYLTEVNLNEMFAALELILDGKFITEKRMMLEAVICLLYTSPSPRDS